MACSGTKSANWCCTGHPAPVGNPQLRWYCPGNAWTGAIRPDGEGDIIAHRNEAGDSKFRPSPQLLHHPDGHHHDAIDNPPPRLPSLILPDDSAYYFLLGTIFTVATLAI
jgi:hypothetical protein